MLTIILAAGKRSQIFVLSNLHFEWEKVLKSFLCQGLVSSNNLFIHRYAVRLDIRLKWSVRRILRDWLLD